MKSIITSFILFSISVSPLAWANAEYQEFVGAAGAVNWTKGQVIADGVGAAPPNKPPQVVALLACRAAIAEGQRNLLESIKGVRVESNTTVANYMLQSDKISTSISGVVRGSQIIEKTPMQDGTCKVKLAAPLAGNVSRSVYDEVFSQEGERTMLYQLIDATASSLHYLISPAYASPSLLTASNLTSNEWQQQIGNLEKRIAFLENQMAINPPQKTSDGKPLLPTGLIVDARGSNFIPSMSPKIRKLRGNVMYPKQSAKEAILGDGRLVSLFTRNLQFAQRHPKVGDRPLVVKALRTWGDSRTEIVVGKQSAAKLAKLIENNFFADAGVIIVLD